MAWTNWSQTWTTRTKTTTSKKPQKRSSKNMRWDWMRVIFQADQRPKQNHKDEILPPHTQELYLSGERTWTDNEPQDYSLHRLSSVEAINSSSSSWKSTSRKRWSDRILENKRLSSGSFCVLSSLVWRKVEEIHGKRRRKQEKIPGLYWFFRSNSVPPSSPRSFRTMSWFRTVSSSTFITPDVQSIYIP